MPSETKDTSDDFTHRELGVVYNRKQFTDSWRINSTTMPNEHLFGKDLDFLYDSSFVVGENGNESNDTNNKDRHYCACENPASAGALDNITLQCNFEERSQPCKSNTDSSIVTSCPDYKGPITDNDDIVDVTALEFDIDMNTEEKAPEFRDGWDEEKATKICTDKIHQGVPVDALGEVAGLTDTEYIQSCILDIKYTATTEFIKDTIGAMQTYTVMEVSKNETLATEQSEDGSQSILEYVKSLLCPNNCSENGNCSSGICSCFDGYIGDDCAEDITAPPQNISLPSNGLCGTKTRACIQTNIYGVFPSENVWCKRRHFQISANVLTYSSHFVIIKAEYRNTFMVSVSLGPSRRKRSTSDLLVTEGYEISLSNDNVTFGEPVNIIIYDEECQECHPDTLTCVIIDSCLDLSTTATTTSAENSDEATTLTATTSETDTTTLTTTLSYSTTDEINDALTTEITTELESTPIYQGTTQKSTITSETESTTVDQESTATSTTTTERQSTVVYPETTTMSTTTSTEMELTTVQFQTTQKSKPTTTETDSTPGNIESTPKTTTITTERELTSVHLETTQKSKTTTDSETTSTYLETTEKSKTTTYADSTPMHQETFPKSTTTEIESTLIQQETTLESKTKHETSTISKTLSNNFADTDNMTSYIGPFIGAGTVIVFLFVFIIVLVSRKQMANKQSVKIPQPNTLPYIEGYTIYKGRPKSLADTTNGNAKQHFRYATRMNTDYANAKDSGKSYFNL